MSPCLDVMNCLDSVQTMAQENVFFFVCSFTTSSVNFDMFNQLFEREKCLQMF